MTGIVLSHATMSLDGFIAGPDDAMDWVFAHGGPSAAGTEVILTTGAVLAGRRLYDLGISRVSKGWRAGIYGGAWTGPVFVLTHRPPDAADDPGITFLTGDLRAAVAAARAAAGGKNVVLFGASLTRQCLAEGLLDEIVIHLAPVLIGDGVRLFDSPGSAPVSLERIGLAASGQVTDLRFRVAK
jgi:dihydrofolate reductase